MEARLNRLNELQQSVIDYYDNTWLDYRVLWLNKNDRAIHFGFYETFDESHSEALSKLNKIMSEKVQIVSTDKVLDAGCGQGGSSLWMAQNIGCDTIGITLVPHQVQTAEKEALRRGIQLKSKFYQKDYTDTGFESASFDVVWACESICHAHEKLKFYSEAYRLLKPGGRIIIAEYIRQSRNNNAKDENILNAWCKGWSMPDLDTWEEHEYNMKHVGFESISKTDITKNVIPSLTKLFRISRILLPLGILLNKVGIRNKVKHANQTASIKQYEALSRNLWYYCIYSAYKPNLS